VAEQPIKLVAAAVAADIRVEIVETTSAVVLGGKVDSVTVRQIYQRCFLVAVEVEEPRA